VRLTISSAARTSSTGAWIAHWKAKGLDFRGSSTAGDSTKSRGTIAKSDHGPPARSTIDDRGQAPALDNREKVRLTYRIRNANCSVGAMLSDGRGSGRRLPDDTARELRRIATELARSWRTDHVRAAGRDQRLRRQGIVRRAHRGYPDPTCPAKPEQNIASATP
jgi:hypothetical protein